MQNNNNKSVSVILLCVF